MAANEIKKLIAFYEEDMERCKDQRDTAGYMENYARVADLQHQLDDLAA